MAPPRIPIEDRFWTKVTKTETCWTWNARKDKDGYGEVQVLGEKRKAHRIAWSLAFGDIPTGLRVLHRCDNPPCVRPEHLFLGTNSVNSSDMVNKNRQARGVRQGLSKLTEDDVIAIRRRYAAGASMKELSTEFPVNASNIWFVVNRATWRHI